MTYLNSIEPEQAVIDLIDSGNSCAVIRLGDGDLALLAHPEVQRIPDRHRLCRATPETDTALKPMLVEAIKAADIVGLRENWQGVERMPYFAPDFAERVLTHYDAKPKRVVSINCMYRLTVDGRLFRSLAGKTVLPVGAHAWALHGAWMESEFQDYYAAMEVGGIGYLAHGVLAPMSNAATYIEEIWRAVKAEVHLWKHDAILFSCGNVSKVLAVRARDELGVQAIDWGEMMSIMAGVPRPTRPHIGHKFDYRSPCYAPRPTAREVADILYCRDACAP